ncbi:MAG: hypothetical protein Q7S40_31630 [Opitutaceae bacterium]|nr:hypothetical protein [Opitutaceae bacterium]
MLHNHVATTQRRAARRDGVDSLLELVRSPRWLSAMVKGNGINDESVSLQRDDVGPQQFKNGEIHDWYRLVLGYSDHLVGALLDEFKLGPEAAVLDPFSGAGTTAVECKKRGINCWAVDANPSSCFATKAKTNWRIDRSELVRLGLEITSAFQKRRGNLRLLESDRTTLYVTTSGMVKRGWITRSRLFDVIALKHAIDEFTSASRVRELLRLAAMHVLVHTASNVRFGPELYCGQPRNDPVLDAFLHRVLSMAADLEATDVCPPAETFVRCADSRKLSAKLINAPSAGFDAVITSPPYPAEHDYTRNSRLELAYLENVRDVMSLRYVKRSMVRSHTKGIYKTDCDDVHVTDFSRLQRIVRRIEKQLAWKTASKPATDKTRDCGFERLYGKVTQEYFGGMRRHFRALRPLLKDSAHCAYVVGDQSSYFQIKIPTAKLLGEIAATEGFEVTEIRKWRERWSTGTKRFLKEHILFFRPSTPA